MLGSAGRIAAGLHETWPSLVKLPRALRAKCVPKLALRMLESCEKIKAC